MQSYACRLWLNHSIRTKSFDPCRMRYTATGVVSSVSAADYLKCSPMFSGIESACFLVMQAALATLFFLELGYYKRSRSILLLCQVPTAICILGFFAACMLMGMQDLCSRILGIYQQNPMCKESSAVASMLFVFHLLDSQIGWSLAPLGRCRWGQSSSSSEHSVWSSCRT